MPQSLDDPTTAPGGRPNAAGRSDPGPSASEARRATDLTVQALRNEVLRADPQLAAAYRDLATALSAWAGSDVEQPPQAVLDGIRLLRNQLRALHRTLLGIKAQGTALHAQRLMLQTIAASERGLGHLNSAYQSANNKLSEKSAAHSRTEFKFAVTLLPDAQHALGIHPRRHA